MKILSKSKDGGPESSVTGYFLIEIKWLFTIVLLHFKGKSRNAFHTHAFNCWNWLVKGNLQETTYPSYDIEDYMQGAIFPIYREDFHQVEPKYCDSAWVLSIRGPWKKTWKEYLPSGLLERELTWGRKVVN